MPEVEQTPGVISFTWLEEHLTFRVSRIKERSDGTVSAEVTITSDKPGMSGLFQSRVNLTAAQTLDRHAKQLLKEYPEWPEWSHYFKQVAHDTLERLRAGEPLEIISMATDLEPPQYLLWPLVVEGHPVILFGDGGVGKSELALVIYICLSLPWRSNTLHLDAPGVSHNVIYLDWESDATAVAWQLRSLIRGQDLPDIDLLYRRCRLSLADDTESIQRYIEETSATVMILDSLGLAAGGDLNTAPVATAFYAALRQLNITSIIIAHTSKDQDKKTKSVYGTAFFQNLARSIWEVRKVQKTGEDTLDIAIYHRKANFSRLQQPMGFTFTFNGQQTYVEYQDPKEVPEFRQHMDAGTQVLEQLREGPQTQTDLEAALESVTGPTIRQVLSRFKRKGLVTKRDKQWALHETRWP
jgi:hypothetical protein